MSAYYDSDDDFAWGPVTLREFIRDYRNPATKKISKPIIVHPSAENQNQIMPQIMKTADNTEASTKTGNVTTSTNEYCTPNETMNTQPSSQCLTAMEDTVYASCEENNSDNTYVKFLGLANNCNTEFDLRNVHQTLVECCTINKSLENIDSPTENEDSYLTNNTDISCQSEHFEDDEIIVLSSDDEKPSFQTAKSITKETTANSITHETNISPPEIRVFLSTHNESSSFQTAEPIFKYNVGNSMINENLTDNTQSSLEYEISGNTNVKVNNLAEINDTHLLTTITVDQFGKCILIFNSLFFYHIFLY